MHLQTEDEGGQTEAEQDGHGNQRDDHLAERRGMIIVRCRTGEAEHSSQYTGKRGGGGCAGTRRQFVVHSCQSSVFSFGRGGSIECELPFNARGRGGGRGRRRRTFLRWGPRNPPLQCSFHARTGWWCGRC